jgi:hypothetical protein
MVKKNENIYFLLIELKKIKFAALNTNGEVFFSKEILINDISINENLITLKNFLDHNIFDIENKLNTYVKDINLIIDSIDFLVTDVSTIHNFKNYFDQPDNTSNFLANIKNNVIENLDDYDLSHMIINKYIVDGISHFSLGDSINGDKIFLEIRFICLKKNISLQLQKILSQYEISLKKIFCHKYIKDFANPNDKNVFKIANKIKDGLNPKEIFLINKLPKNKGFFEKFFNFFG